MTDHAQRRVLIVLSVNDVGSTALERALKDMAVEKGVDVRIHFPMRQLPNGSRPTAPAECQVQRELAQAIAGIQPTEIVLHLGWAFSLYGSALLRALRDAKTANPRLRLFYEDKPHLCACLENNGLFDGPDKEWLP